ncbi:DEAD/DEAH box helicase [Glutamicibacter ardleyensis]|uniref:DEAD/DEAH box helicase n=1 Tax=Glutamicibacter ardleyensis TaxID=225894 RepID=UPI003FB8783C
MLVLHAFWSPDEGPGIWAEDSSAEINSPSQVTKDLRLHPFAVPAQALAELHSGTSGNTVLRLPSVRRAPLDSPQLVRSEPRKKSTAKESLLSWKVPVLWLDSAALVNLMRPDSNTEPSQSVLNRLLAPEKFVDDVTENIDVAVASSLRYLAQIALFADELAFRGRVIPQVAWSEDAAQNLLPLASWQPVLRGPDSLAFNDIVAAMPPAFRAHQEVHDKRSLVSSAVDFFVDAAVRLRLPADLPVLPARRGRQPAQTPASELWISALFDDSGVVNASTSAISDLRDQLRVWDEYVKPDQSSATLVFRLSEIDENHRPASVDASTQWNLEFLLRSVSDQSLLVTAEQAWNDGKDLRRWLGRPRETLLAQLGKAARIHTPIQDGLRQSKPSGLYLDAQGAYDFLSHAATDLTEAGFEVMLPSWWNQASRVRLKLGATSRSSSSDAAGESKFGLDQLCEFEWNLAIGDQSLTAAELAALAEAKTPLIRLRGQWVAIDQEQLRRGLEFLNASEGQRATAAQLLQLATSHPDDLALPLDLAEVTADGWVGELLKGAASQELTPVEPPGAFGATLRPYQQRGLSWLNFMADLGLGACLADDMGLGKTVQLLALESLRREAAGETGPTLLLCPMSLIGNWEAEAKKFAPYLRVHVHHGAARRTANFAEVLDSNDLIITTYSTLARDLELFQTGDWNRIVFDEAQAVKNRNSQAAKALRQLPAGHRIALTGTPVENRLGELYSIMDVLNPGILGSPTQFRSRYAIPVERHGDEAAAASLRAITGPYLLRRVKTDKNVISDLPEKIEIKQYYNLSEEQASLYQSVLDEMMGQIENSDGIARRGLVLAAMAKLKQVCNHPAQLLHDGSAVAGRSGKVSRLETLLEEIVAEGDKALCFTQYTEFAQMLLPHLSARLDADVLYLHGGTSRAKRTELVEQFQNSTRPTIFLLSLKAGGTGLNLTAANHVLHLDRWWNPAVENQATDRAFRIGQKRNVQVRKFICRGTLEERIDTMIEEKQALAQMVVGDGEGWLTEMSTQNLRELFALSTEAIGE